MSVEALRTFEDPFYTMVTTLDNVDYLFDFRFNTRECAWAFDMLLTDGTLLASGVKVLCNQDLLAGETDTRLPPGVLMAFPNEGDASPPGIDALGIDKRVTLTYVSASELA